MTIASKFLHQITTADWRLTPGYLHSGYADFEGSHILLGRFLADRTSEDPLLEKELFAPDSIFEARDAMSSRGIFKKDYLALPKSLYNIALKKCII